MDSFVGRGIFVCGRRRPRMQRAVEGRADIDLSMNMPPEPELPELRALMQSGFAIVGRQLRHLLRYQDDYGSADDREAGAPCLRRRGLLVDQEWLLVVPGTQCALLAILTVIT